MMSVNQMSICHTILEAPNVLKSNSSEQIKMKWVDESENTYSLRNKNDLRIPEKPSIKCNAFTYYGGKLYNKLPRSIKETLNNSTFKILTKEWVWKNIPSF